jgi:hypothetical protein
MKKYIVLFVALVSVLSCKKDSFVHPDYLVFGSIQGNCSNGCRFVYYLDATKLAEDTTVKYFSTHDLNDFKKQLPDDKFQLAEDLINKIPLELTKTTKTTFIDLNSSSPNLWYAEIKLDGRVHTYTFDNAPSSTPSYLKSFADEMIRVIGLIHP